MYLLAVLVDSDGTSEITEFLMPARLTLPLFRSGFIVVVVFAVFYFICKTNWVE
jgi:hypothetical protein